MTFLEQLQAAIQKNNSLLCVGLDADREKMPKHLLAEQYPFFAFNKAIIDKTYDLVSCYKINSAFYEVEGVAGLTAMKSTVAYIKQTYPDIPVICDAKRADIGNTSLHYARTTFDEFGFDAITVSPYMGKDSIEPFLAYKNKGVIVLCRTSNQGAADFQDLPVNGEPLYVQVARKVNNWHAEYGNCLLVVGATWPEELAVLRRAVPQLFFLVPGVGAQGGDIEKIMTNGRNAMRSGLIITSSRAILYAAADATFADAARDKAIETLNEINKYR